MNKKKILILALSLVLCSTAFVSCGGNQTGEDGSESTTKAVENETEAGEKKGIRRGVNEITGRVTDGIENVRDGVASGVDALKNGVKKGFKGAKRDLKKGADNVGDSIVDGSLDKEDATHGLEEQSGTEQSPESVKEPERMHRRAVPGGK